uniref:Uncharacterized protein n=1 Tax=Peronospora matthiolae TaxID=2874970 RepID=A0AAV1UZF9_9STRA
MTGGRALALDVVDEFGPLDTPLLERLELVVVVFGLFIVVTDDAEHRYLSGDERIDDILESGHGRVSDDPPLIRRQLVAGIDRYIDQNRPLPFVAVAGIKYFGAVLDEDVHLVQRALDVQDMVLSLVGHARLQVVESPDLSRLAVTAGFDQLVAPKAVQRVHELHQHV